MNSPKTADLKKRLRAAFNDDFGTQWSDDVLSVILTESQREYALLSGCLVGETPLISSAGAVQRMPKDFISVIRIEDVSGREIPLVSYRKLADRYGDFRKQQGNDIRAVVMNFDGFGKYRVFPALSGEKSSGRIFYSRLPNNAVMEVRNTRAVEYYALFLMYQFAGKPQAQVSYSAFMNEVNRERREALGISGKHIPRTGVYY